METILKGLRSLGISLIPAVYVGLFLYWRYRSPQLVPLFQSPFPPSSVFGVGPYILDIALYIVIGVLIYYLHRGVFHRFIWFIQRHTYGIPQFEFHKQICDKFSYSGQIRDKIGISQACLFQLQIYQAKNNPGVQVCN